MAERQIAPCRAWSVDDAFKKLRRGDNLLDFGDAPLQWMRVTVPNAASSWPDSFYADGQVQNERWYMVAFVARNHATYNKAGHITWFMAAFEVVTCSNKMSQDVRFSFLRTLRCISCLLTRQEKVIVIFHITQGSSTHRFNVPGSAD